MLLYKDLTTNQKNTIDYNFDGGADWHLTGFIYFDSKSGRVAFYKIEESEMDH
jgi:hypothetical protein